MASVGELSVDVKARINDFSKNLTTALGQANSFASRMSTIGKKDFFAPMQETLNGMKRDFGQIIQGIVLAQTFYSGLQLFKQLTSAVYEYTDALNYAQVTFSNLFRDISMGEEFVAVLQQYAARSPFDFTDIEKGARQLSAYGIQAKNLMYVMEGIGNLSAVTGDPQTFETVSRAMGQIYSKGKLSAEEMRQLAEAGLNVKEVYARLGVEAGNVGKANIDAATALNTIVEVLNDTYAGAMDAANTTMRGMLANTKDVLLSVTSAVFQPAYDRLQRVLKWIQIGLDQFQQTFTTDGLIAAINQAFGPDTSTRIQQFIAICQYLGSTLYQLLVPAMKLLGMYGQTVMAVFGNMVRVLGPVIQFFAALLNSFMSSAQGAKLLQSALMGLVVIKMVGGFVTALTSVVGLMSNALTGVISVVSAASGALTILTGAEAGAAAGAYGAAAAWKYFTKALNVNPIVLALTIILSLIAAVVGLRAVLGQTTDSLAEMSGVDFKKFFEGIKQATGDAEKFKKPFEDAGDAVEDANGELDKTKKKLEGLLSFDEVFKLPERTDPDGSGSGDNDSTEIYEPGDFGAIEFPEVEPLDPRSLFPDIKDILAWFEDQPWWKIGQYVSNGIATGLKMYKKTPSKALVDLMDDLIKTASKKLDKFNIKERMGKLAEKAAEARDYFKSEGKELGKLLYDSIEEEIGPEKAKKMKLKQRLEKIGKEAGKGTKAWSETGAKLAKALEKELSLELGRDVQISSYMEDLAKEAEKSSAKFAKAGKSLAERLTKEIETYLGPTRTKELKIKENLEKIAKEATESGKAWDEAGSKTAKEFFESLNKEFAQASIDPDNLKKSVAKLAEELKASGVEFTDTGKELSDDFIKSIEKNLNEKSFGEVAKEFGENLVKAFKSIPKNISEALAKDFTPTAIFGAIAKSFTADSGESIFKAFTTSLKGAITPAKIAQFFKTGLKDMGITMIGEMLFEELAKWLEENGLTEASKAVSNFGPIVASGIGTAIATKSPWGFVVGAVWGALFEALGKGLEEGDWTSMLSTVPAVLGGMLGKSLTKGKFAQVFTRSLTNGKGSIWAMIGSIVTDLLFGSIADSMEANGDANGAALIRGIGDCVSGALGGAAIGALFGPWGALAGAIIGALVSALVGHWDEISKWWTDVAVPWFENLPNAIAQFFADADKWLSDDKLNPLAGLWNGIKKVWGTISKFFMGMGKLIVGFITGDKQLLHDAGYDLMDASWEGIQAIWDSDIVKFFTGLAKAIQGFFKDPIGTLKNIGKDIMKGLLNAAKAFFNSDFGKFFGGVLSGIAGFFKDPLGTLTNVGKDIMKGMYDAIVSFFNTDIGKFFSGILKAIVKFIKNPGKALADVGEAIMKGFKDGIDSIWKNIQAFFSGILDWIIEHKGPVNKDRKALQPAGKAIINGLFDGIKSIWENVANWFLSIPNKIKGFFKNAINWLVGAGKNIIKGLKEGFTTFWMSVNNWLKERKDKIKAKFEGALNWLFNAGKNVFKGLKEGFTTVWTNINEWLKERKDKIKGKFETAINWLVNAGKNVFKGLKEGFTTIWTNINDWLNERKDKIKGKFETAVTWLFGSGKNIINGLKQGLSEAWANVKAFFSGIKSRISGVFTHAKDWLWNAGWNIITGFHNAMVNAFKGTQDFIKGIGQWIIDHKGPIEYDFRMLQPAGEAIMLGFNEGLERKFKTVMGTVSGFGSQIEGAFTAPQLTIGRMNAPSMVTAPATATSAGTQEVANPYLTQSSDDASQRPIMYVGTLIADKQGLRELKKKLDIVDKEQSRYR